MPLELSGTVIAGIRVEFPAAGHQDRAEQGADALGPSREGRGRARLGELALVDGEGRIGPLGRCSSTP